MGTFPKKIWKGKCMRKLVLALIALFGISGCFDEGILISKQEEIEIINLWGMFLSRIL